ncbi:gamma-glutamyl-gamma-aminobutyrate hydrolase family protein [Thioalkalivibrio sp.]|uniref:gamma-glutamyl-gamma-aminobutyrate hydrolase family protein n=1 Tax=Thioalkalivibrio sp. TaxID=2093813 RepID=UPI0025F9FFCC|nr:gamma-glutamyl-gamma-aminobutyrate hydrolase family protein [Thioalkalivibrio sp.]
MTGSERHDATDAVDRGGVKPRRPLVVITGPDRGGWLAWFFTALAVRRAGGRAVHIRPSHPCHHCRFDALIVGGGADVDPSLYGDFEGPGVSDIQAAERRWSQRIFGYAFYPILWLLRRMFQSHGGTLDKERDRLEKALINRALDEHKPVLGICRGMQLINVVLGGTLNRNLDGFYVETPQARSLLPVKHVTLKPGTRLASVFDREDLWVNALHDQSVNKLGTGLRVAACEATGVVQAIEAVQGWSVGVQWHPEYLPQKETQQRLFRALVRAAAEGMEEERA